MRGGNVSIIGTRSGWNGQVYFGLAQPDRRQHLYVIGKTGAGKSTLLRNLLIQDVEEGRGCALLDPHGDLAEELLDYIPPRRTDEVIYFNPADLDHPIGFNLLRTVDPDLEPLIAAGVVATFKHLWQDSWGPRMEYIFYNTVAALLACPNTTLLGVPRMLTDPDYRARVVARVPDPRIRNFWLVEFPGLGRIQAEAIAPVLNKVGMFLSSPMLRHILGQVRSTVDLRRAMDRGQIFIANLSKGKIGEEPANLLGSLLVTSFQLASLERAELAEEERSDFFLYLDEYHAFSTDTFASVLSESRKYGLCLTLAHQYLDQVREQVRRAVFGNVASWVSFRVGNEDAEVLARELDCPPQVLIDLDRFETRARLLENGDTLQPFFGHTDPPRGTRYGRGGNIMKTSRERFARRRAVIQKKIESWMGGAHGDT